MKNLRLLNIILVLAISISSVSAQKGFKYYGSKKGYIDVKFKLINNLIVLPIKVNGYPFNFILDSGVNKTIIFNASAADSLLLKIDKVHRLQGLGSGAPVDATISANNRLTIKNLVSNNHKVYIIIRDKFDLSSKMGITVHGVIGFDLLKNIPLRINYNARKIRFFDPEKFELDVCKKCEVFPLTMHKNKPFINAEVLVDENDVESVPVKMLIDSGGSDAIWLFEHSKKKIVTPENYFDDFLGVGLSGNIFGKRSRIEGLKLGQFELERPTVSFLDSVSTENARKFKERNGSIGNGVLKRFKVWIDYPNSRMMLKKSASLSSGFEYNMTGIEVVYDGKILVTEKDNKIVRDKFGSDLTSNNSNKSGFALSFVTNYTYKFKPNYKINSVLKDSPAFEAGVKPGDILLKINGRPVHNFDLNEIVAKFQQKDSKKIKLTLQRDGKLITVEFKMKRLI